MDYAGFWKRLAAALIDGLVLGALWVLIGFVISAFSGASTGAAEGLGIVALILAIAMQWLYFALLQSSDMQATLGKKALGIKVTDLEGNRIGFARATGRYFGKFLSSLIFLIGYLMAAFTKKKQALHDMLAGCLVVNA